jgi:acetate kinase
MNVLVANIGSTSFKYRVLDLPTDELLAEGRVERIAEAGGYDAAVSRCLHGLTCTVDAVGFKAVHAGPLGGSRLVDDEVLQAMEEFSFFAPAHNPPYIEAMRSFERALPGLPLVAVFETAFFDSMDEASTTYAVPYAWRKDLGVRRYGFHGASHRAASERAQALLKKRDLRHISCHLGGSSSLAAIRAGIATDTSFGISPQSGLPQNNRVGDLDSFAVLFVMKRLGLSIDQMASVLATESGWAGLSGTCGDVRDVTGAAESGNEQARLAINVFVRAVRHYLGAFLVELGGLDVITFSGGIGENSPDIRAAICAGLTSFGIELDPVLNGSRRGEGAISTHGSAVSIHVVPADEERIVARETFKIVQSRS